MLDIRKTSALITALAASALIAASGQAGRMVADTNKPTQTQPVVPLYAASIVELDQSHSGHFFTTAYINNKPVKVLVDTGATSVAMSYEDARKSGLNMHGLKFDIPVSTANGTTKAARVQLRRVEVDNILVRDVTGVVMQKGALNGTLLGMSFLSKLRSFQIRDGKLILEN